MVTFQDARLEALQALAARFGYTFLDQNLRLFGARKVERCFSMLWPRSSRVFEMNG